MGFDDLVDCSYFISSAIGQVGCSAEQASYAIGKLSEAVGSYSYAEGCSSSLSCRQPTVKNIVMMSIVRKGSLPERQITIDNEKIDWNVLEKNFGPLNKSDIVFHKDGWDFN